MPNPQTREEAEREDCSFCHCPCHELEDRSEFDCFCERGEEEY